MSGSDRPCNTISRRSLLKGAVAFAGVALIPLAAMEGSARAASKLAKPSVKYQDAPNGDKQCSNCIQYLPPDSSGKAHCKVVQGIVSPHGYCIAYSPAK